MIRHRSGPTRSAGSAAGCCVPDWRTGPVAGRRAAAARSADGAGSAASRAVPPCRTAPMVNRWLRLHRQSAAKCQLFYRVSLVPHRSGWHDHGSRSRGGRPGRTPAPPGAFLRCPRRIRPAPFHRSRPSGCRAGRGPGVRGPAPEHPACSGFRREAGCCRCGGRPVSRLPAREPDAAHAATGYWQALRQDWREA